MFKIQLESGKTVEDLSLYYYEKLNQRRKKDGIYFKDSLISRIEDKAKFHQDNKDREKERFYRLFLRRNLLHKIITGKPKYLQLISQYFETLIYKKKIPSFYSISNKTYKSNEFGREVLEVFGYQNLRGGSIGTWLGDELAVEVCPYCNLEFAYKSGTSIFYQFDHFISKVTAPYLSVSFYNLIPSCNICNTQGKGTKLYNISSFIHPYTSDFNRLITMKANLTELRLNPKSHFHIDFDRKLVNNKFENKIINYISDFKLDKRYKRPAVKKEILRLLDVSEKYPESKKTEIIRSSNNLGFSISELEIEKKLLNVYCIPGNETDASQMPFGKFKLDTARTLEIIS